MIAIDDNEKYRYGCYEVEFLKTIHSTDILSYAVKVITNNNDNTLKLFFIILSS